jgi:hypothetical protein
MPRSISADAGRDAKADLDLVAAGLLSLEDYYGSQGWAGREKIEQIAAEQELVHELDETGLLAQRLYSKPGAAQAKPEPEASAEEPKPATADEDEEEVEDESEPEETP